MVKRSTTLLVQQKGDLIQSCNLEDSIYCISIYTAAGWSSHRTGHLAYYCCLRRTFFVMFAAATTIILLNVMQPCASSHLLPLPAPASDFYVPVGVSYHNVATLGPSPKSVVKAVIDSVTNLASDPTNEYFGGNGVAIPATQAMESVREQAAVALNAFLNETLIMPSTTISLNNIAFGLISSNFVKRGDRVLTTDQEHAGGLRCWQHYTKVEKYLSSLDVVNISVNPPPKDTKGVLSLFEQALRSKSYRVIALSHVTTTNGLRLPIKEIATLAHKYGAIVVVDGAQAHGGIKVDVHDLDVDVYATSSHKWLLAPKGSGLLYIKQGTPVSATRFDNGYSPYTGATGTRPMHTIAGLGKAITFFEQYGFDEIEKWNMKLRNIAYYNLLNLNISGLVMVSPPPGPLASPIITVGLPGNITSMSVSTMLYKYYKCIVKVTGHAVFPEEGGSTMPAQATRFSFHLFNGEKEVISLIESFGKVVRNLVGGN